jgi:tripartite-type tricarboxylate transporter receptor subunit TctC
MLRRRSVIAALLGSLATARLPIAIGQPGYPNRPIRLVVPYAPGGNTDLVARIYADKLSTILGTPVVVENRAGAGTVVGTEYVARSLADGYTILFGTSAYAINASLYPALPYDPEKSLDVISVVAEVPLVLSVNPKIPVNSSTEFVELLRKNPDKYTFASAGNGSAIHMAVELLKYQEKVVVTHVPYKGAGPALMAVVAGQVDFIIDAVSTSAPLVKSGRLKALAVTSEKRSTVLPDIPTMKEVGFQDYSTTIWNAILVPAGTPDLAIKRLAQAMTAAANNPEFQHNLNKLGVESLSTSPADAVHRMQHEITTWASVIKSAGIKLE